MSDEVNKSIKCDVENCEHHNEKGFCSLDSIKVSSDKKDPNKSEQINCESFKA